MRSGEGGLMGEIDLGMKKETHTHTHKHIAHSQKHQNTPTNQSTDPPTHPPHTPAHIRKVKVNIPADGLSTLHTFCMQRRKHT